MAMNNQRPEVTEKVCFNCKKMAWLVGVGQGVRCYHKINTEGYANSAIHSLRDSCDFFERKIEKCILGVANLSLCLNRAKKAKLELDLLRLIYAVKEIRSHGINAQGYFLVMNVKELVYLVEKWQQKYAAGASVEIILMDLSQQQADGLEKIADAKGQEKSGKLVDHRSIVLTEHEEGKSYLAEYIQQKENTLNSIRNEICYPFKVRWDYYAQIKQV